MRNVHVLGGLSVKKCAKKLKKLVLLNCKGIFIFDLLNLFGSELCLFAIVA